MSGIVLIGMAFVLVIVLMRTIRIVPQKQVKIIERLGKYHRTAEAGLNGMARGALEPTRPCQGRGRRLAGWAGIVFE